MDVPVGSSDQERRWLSVPFQKKLKRLLRSDSILVINHGHAPSLNESAADQYAAQFLETTGQSGQGLINFFDNFRAQEVLSQSRRYEYFRSHPLSSDRIDKLRERVAESPYTFELDSEEDLHRHAMMKAKLSRDLRPSRDLQHIKYAACNPRLPSNWTRKFLDLL